jgi:hypothetical protein
MTRAAASGPRGHGWQLILADLALILFLLTLSALPAAEAESRARLADSDARADETRRPRMAEVAAAQALYRPVTGGPGIGAWLAVQPRDPRATLTIFARHRRGEEGAAWNTAAMLAREARKAGVAVRIIVTEGTDSDLYASLAYDAPQPTP